ncbi:uncharacterized protein LOC122060066 [Macadamia integrifolia]|uniref:uncharacterized protein LOC122060066 n=1 Tax=Macadamia integrifolia TaxID=60698 RepID=UPI001C5328CA|nr:uncharacterized protein LOC122060066 [Macadamia integrifolia]XP_042479160.1 uncharacterized protein LOC122060066 [Macadamia integrifolia]XP_042479161.1 uncharacterized protein LOC122060066 [Macadamia integrifolia]XP_042479162.1 uncharacterized protein LOC122060066 [Macadamia integrifolia]XP_042479163.1 uncharacterized protein LOC122060066 [Macadamia integrifolia]XP_042479164.1 uncharacterized protein LOC122060066 [Macadamia integrifolia]
MKALYWNIRGIKKAAARLALRNILRDKRPDFLCIAEPMIPSDAFPTLFFNKLGFDPDLIHNERLGGVSNLWLIWRRGVAKPVVLSSSEQQISVSVQWAQEIFILSVVHAKCLRAARRELWTDLVATHPGLTTPWMIFGDFNATLLSSEKRGPGIFNLGSAGDFGAMVDTCSLIQVPSQGRKFTWTNNRRRGHVSAVLDRSFCNEAWISYFQECHQFVLQRVASDHTPILVVSEGSERPKNCPFRFQRFWADHEGYLNAVKSSWVNDIPGSPMMVMAQKLKRLKVFLRSWAKENFPNFNLEMMEAKKCMEEIQTEIDRDGINDSIYAKEADAKTRYLKALQNYEKLWAEKSRSRWRNQGDRCSKFFHISVKIRRMKNSIKSLKMVDGTLISDREQIKEYVAGYYEHFHKGTPLTNHMDLLQCIPNVLEEWDRGRLDGIPSDSEIKHAVWDLDPDSAPGPDGFPGAFYKSCWDIISSDLCNAIRWFFRTGFMPYGINNNFLALIPKIEGALSLDKFRPLCMGNFSCKIISKILAMRLSCVLPKIISEEQGAFQKGKIIHSNISLASELANMMFASTRGGGMGLKIDIHKAFDTISWNFIFHVLRRFGFSEKWISWIHQILVSARISVLFNGGPVGFFGVEKGLRQGDPISPMLFIIAEEVLCRGLSELLANNSIKALSGPRGAIIPTHILFADDVFIFSNASIRYVKNLNNFLAKYQSFSGQKINLDKSKLFLGSVPASRKQAIAEELGISICNFPTRYLGVEIFKGRLKKESLIPILDKVKGRLAGWKGKILSMAGRVELVRSVILGMMNHSSAVYWWPSSLIAIMERWMRNFIWTGEIDTAKKISVRWDLCCRPKDEGGLGLRRLRDINKAMLCNMVWRVKHENSLACKFLRARFLRGDGSFKKSYKPSSIWPGFRKMWDFMTTKEAWMIGNGDSINFWSDKWLGGKSILELVGLEGESSLLCKGKVSDFIDNFKWKLPNVISPLLHDIFEKIRTIKIPSYPCEDMCLWSLSSDGIFNSNSAWEDIRIRNPKVPWFSLIWGKKMQPRVSIFGWRMVHDKLPTDDVIQKRGIVLVSKCSLCGMEAETSSHIFLQCSYSEEIWLFFCGCFNVQWQPAGTMADFLTWWRRKQKSVCCKEAWIMGLLTVADHIWRERNMRRHDGKERPARYLKQMILEDIQFAKPSTKGEVKTMSDLICCRKLGIPIQRSPPKAILEVFWCRPEANWIKLNFDGSSRGNPGRAGAGGIFRDHRGGVLGSYKIFMGVSGVFEAEIEGLMVGLMRAREMGIPCLWVETDSSAVAISIQQNKIPWFALQRWIFLQPYLESITWKITHNFREANSIADYLARDAAKTGISAINVDVPANIKDFIRRDADGRPNYRFD